MLEARTPTNNLLPVLLTGMKKKLSVFSVFTWRRGRDVQKGILSMCNRRQEVIYLLQGQRIVKSLQWAD